MQNSQVVENLPAIHVVESRASRAKKLLKEARDLAQDAAIELQGLLIKTKAVADEIVASPELFHPGLVESARSISIKVEEQCGFLTAMLAKK